MTRPSAARVGLSQPPARRGRSSRNQGASSISSAAGRRSSDHVSSDRQQQQRGQSGKHNSRQIQEYEGKDEEEGTEEELDEEEEELDEEDGEEEEDQRRNRPTSRGHREVTADDEDDENEKGENDDIQVKKIRKIQIDDKTRTFLKKLDRKDVHRKANELVRLLLFSEYRKVPVRREDINRRILGKNFTRAFPYIHNRAQKILRNTFCYEMVELRPRGAENEQTLATAPQTKETGKRKEHDGDDAGEETVSKSTGNRSYVLCSILPQTVIEAMTQPANEGVKNAAQVAEGPSEYKGEGPMLDWSKADGQLGSMGLTYLILSLILLNGRSLPDDRFRASLSRLRLGKETQLPQSMRPDSMMPAMQRQGGNRNDDDNAPSTIARPSSLGNFIIQLVKHQYLEKATTNKMTGATQSRALASNANSLGDGVEIEWRWGPRAEAEIGEVAVANFVSAVYVDGEDEGREEQDEDLSLPAHSRSQSGRSGRNQYGTQGRRTATQGSTQTQRAKQTQALRKEIERAAGSQLTV